MSLLPVSVRRQLIRIPRVLPFSLMHDAIARAGTYKHAFFQATCNQACNPPAAPNSYYASIGGYTWRWYCNAGYCALFSLCFQSLL